MYEQYEFKTEAMAYDSGYIKNEVKNHYKNIIILWCLCKYLEDYNDVNGLQHHEKIKLRTEINEIAKLKAKNKNESEVKRQELETLFYDGEDYGTNYMSVISVFTKKFTKEKITKGDAQVYVAKEFCKEAKQLIELISTADFSQINTYLNSKFKKGGNI